MTTVLVMRPSDKIVRLHLSILVSKIDFPPVTHDNRRKFPFISLFQFSCQRAICQAHQGIVIRNDISYDVSIFPRFAESSVRGKLVIIHWLCIHRFPLWNLQDHFRERRTPWKTAKTDHLHERPVPRRTTVAKDPDSYKWIPRLKDHFVKDQLYEKPPPRKTTFRKPYRHDRVPGLRKSWSHR